MATPQVTERYLVSDKTTNKKRKRERKRKKRKEKGKKKEKEEEENKKEKEINKHIHNRITPHRTNKYIHSFFILIVINASDCEQMKD